MAIEADGLSSTSETYSLTGALTLGQTPIQITAKKGFTLFGYELESDDLDTNASPLVRLELGDGNDTNRFLSASTIGTSGGTAEDTLDSLYRYSVDDTIDLRVSVAPATGATTGDITLTLYYYYSATITQLIEKVLRRLTVLGAADPVTAEDAEIVTDALNELHDEISNMGLNVKGDLEWSLDYVPRYVVEPYVALAANKLSDEFGIQGERLLSLRQGADLAWGRLVSKIYEPAPDDEDEDTETDYGADTTSNEPKPKYF